MSFGSSVLRVEPSAEKTLLSLGTEGLLLSAQLSKRMGLASDGSTGRVYLRHSRVSGAHTIGAIGCWRRPPGDSKLSSEDLYRSVLLLTTNLILLN